ncbi:unnamed protein product [Mytilus coruscus]|uniref:Uncharacterized protein n=1 Tax=Mytilus coruscus TaxID=42192 RepID=A0A6J8C2W2_MYTCO|nr:unnamed protein product [Mytilus coruscus]
MVLVENDSNETLYVKATQHKDLTVQKWIGFEVHACGEERGAHAKQETEWHCVQNNDYTQIAPKTILQFSPVAEDKTIYITIKAPKQVICDSLPLRNKRDVVVKVIGELVFVQNPKKKKQMIYRYNIKPECKREADNNFKAKIEDIEWEYKKMQAENAIGKPIACTS